MGSHKLRHQTLVLENRVSRVSDAYHGNENQPHEDSFYHEDLCGIPSLFFYRGPASWQPRSTLRTEVCAHNSVNYAKSNQSRLLCKMMYAAESDDGFRQGLSRNRAIVTTPMELSPKSESWTLGKRAGSVVRCP